MCHLSTSTGKKCLIIASKLARNISCALWRTDNTMDESLYEAIGSYTHTRTVIHTHDGQLTCVRSVLSLRNNCFSDTCLVSDNLRILSVSFHRAARTPRFTSTSKVHENIATAPSAIPLCRPMCSYTSTFSVTGPGCSRIDYTQLYISFLLLFCVIRYKLLYKL